METSLQPTIGDDHLPDDAEQIHHSHAVANNDSLLIGDNETQNMLTTRLANVGIDVRHAVFPRDLSKFFVIDLATATQDDIERRSALGLHQLYIY